MNRPRLVLRGETALYALAILLAALYRLSNLAWPPLSDPEALNALAAAQGTSQSSQFWVEGDSPGEAGPAYLWPTSILLTLFSGSDGAPRLIPALAGIGLVALPILLRRQLGRATALGLAFLIAISPTAVSAARTASPASLSVFALSASLALILSSAGETGGSRRYQWAAGFAGLALVSGATIYFGILSLTAVWLLVRFGGFPSALERVPPVRDVATRSSVLVGGAVAVLLAAGFGTWLPGFSTVFSSLGHWIAGWGTQGDLPAATALASVFLYEPFSLFLAFVGIWFGWRRKDALTAPLVFWALGALAVVLAYPSRSHVDLLWFLVPMLALSTRGLVWSAEELLARVNGGGWSLAAMAGVLFVLQAFVFLQLSSIAIGFVPGAVDLRFRLGLALLGLVLAVVVILLFGLGWSWAISLGATGLAVTSALISLQLAAGWRLSFAQSAASAVELWRPRATTVGIEILIDMLESVSEAQTGRPDALPVEILNPPPPSLAWSLRSFAPPAAEQSLSSGSPPLILSIDVGEEIGLRADYVGQSLVIGERRGWTGALPPDFLEWWIKGSAPRLMDRWLVLLRTDVAGLESVEQLGDELEGN